MFRGPFCQTGIKLGIENTFTGISELLIENDMKYVWLVYERMSEGAKKKQKMDGHNFHNLIKKWKIFVHRMVGVMIACKLSLQQE